MSIILENELGKIRFSEAVIQSVAGGATVECYGVVGMASKQLVKDGLAELLGRDNYQRGIIVRNEEGTIHIDLYVIVSYGVKISEIVTSIQNRVKYEVENKLNFQLGSVNVFIQDVRVTDNV
ncbi:MAG: Asp23/Gls24 family envelope stress response protein [Culicoidibacterales bacterium]